MLAPILTRPRTKAPPGTAFAPLPSHMSLALFCLLGAMVAVTYAVSLAWNARLYVFSKAAGRCVSLHVARTGAVTAALVGFALAGGRPLVAALAGFACAHLAIVSAIRRFA
jgi:hypothetical protein